MRLVHLSDLHLGFRAYPRSTPAGINQREHDVAATFHRVVDRIIELAPDLVVIGGDVFHSVRPGNDAIVATFNEFARLIARLPGVIVVVAAGNHDMPKASESGCILPLFAALGVHVADRASRRFDFPERSLSVLAVPDAPLLARPEFRPNSDATTNVLVLHGEVKGMLPADTRGRDRAALEISHEELGPDAWDYVALGHYHCAKEIAPNCWYSGSIDFTSSDPWSEISTLKGFIERDLETGAQTFHEISPARPFHDLPVIDAGGMDAAQIDSAIESAMAGCPGGIDEACVRLVVHSVDRDAARALNHKAIRGFKRRALSLNLDVRRADVVRLGSIVGPMLQRGASLGDILKARLEERELPSNVDRVALSELADKYLEAATDKVGESAPVLELAGASPALEKAS